MKTTGIVKFVLLTLYLLVMPFAVPAEDSASKTSVTAADFAPLSGPEWTGSLTYLDYSSNEPSQIPVSIRFDEAKSRSIRYHIKYPGEAQYNDSVKIKLSKNGRELNGDSITDRQELPDGTVVITTRAQEEDDGRPADVRTTYSLGASALSIRKEVRYEGSTDYLERNIYRLAR